MNNQDFGKFISTLRKEKGLTQIELAERINVSDKAISRWENGKNYPDIEMLEALANELGVSISELIACKRIETPVQAEVETAKAYIVENSRVKKLKRLSKALVGVIVLIAIILVVPTSFATINGEYDDGTMEIQSLTYKAVKWNKKIGNVNYQDTSWYFFADSKKSIDELWKKHELEIYCPEMRYVDDIRCGSLNIGAEMPKIIYMDYKCVVFYGTCGLVEYDYKDEIVKMRLDASFLKALGFDLPYATEENGIVYIQEDEIVENEVNPISHPISSQLVSRVDKVPTISSDVRIDKLDEETRIEYEIKNDYLTSYDCFDNKDMKAFLIADNDWDMASLKLVIEQDGATKEYKIFK